MAINDELKFFEKKLQYEFKDLGLLRLALTHKSYAYEHKCQSKDLYNERIEYLGDAILEHIISDLLYAHTPLFSEGEMTKKRAEIVCEKSLSRALKKIDGEHFLLLGRCELKTGGRSKEAILCDAYESVLGAIYLDSNFETAREFVLRTLDIEIQEVLDGKTNIVDYKTKLQEKLQENGNVKIEYKVVKEEGPDHDKTFYVEVYLENEKIGEGIGKNRKQAEQLAAEVAYDKYNKC